ncbi:hypothetical protein IHE30_00190 [Mycetohabitans sp. B46]
MTVGTAGSTFWLANLVDRLLVIVVPLVMVWVPGLRLLLTLYGWHVRSRIFYRRYGDAPMRIEGTCHPLSASASHPPVLWLSGQPSCAAYSHAAQVACC